MQFDYFCLRIRLVRWPPRRSAICDDVIDQNFGPHIEHDLGFFRNSPAILIVSWLRRIGGSSAKRKLLVPVKENRALRKLVVAVPRAPGRCLRHVSGGVRRNFVRDHSPGITSSAFRHPCSPRRDVAQRGGARRASLSSPLQ